MNVKHGKRPPTKSGRAFSVKVGFMKLGGPLVLVAALVMTGCATQPPQTPASVQKYWDESQKNTPPVGQTQEAANLEPLKKALAANEAVTVYGLGSSVGKGASLPDPDTQAPAARLSAQLGGLTKGGSTSTNLSVNGSVASEGVTIYREQIKPNKPTVLVLAYGMNDGQPGAYNSGQTITGAIEAINTIATEARQDGVAVLILTTPSPHTTRTDFSFPENLPLLYPAGTTVAVPEEPLTTVLGVPFSARHAEFNAKITELAAAKGFALLDVVPSWAAAVGSQGEDTLFDEMETVHPNLAGHTASYWAAIDGFVASL